MAQAKKSGQKVAASSKKHSAARTAPDRAPMAELPKAPPINIKDEKVEGRSRFTMSSVRADALFDEHPPIPSVFKVTASAARVLMKHWRVFLGLALVYGVLTVIFVQGLQAATNIPAIKNAVGSVPASTAGRIGDGVSLVTSLIGAGGNSVSPTAGPYQFVLAVVVSLATIWGLREAFAQNEEFTMRDALYKGMAPFVTFLLVGLLIVVQLLPFALGAALYSVIVANAIATGILLPIIFIVLFLVLAGVSCYLLCSTLFALYIVTLSGMTPWAAARTARDLVAHRRFTIIRKLLFLPLLLLVTCIVLLLPVVLFAPLIAPWLFIFLAPILLVYAHGYMYTLYRALI